MPESESDTDQGVDFSSIHPLLEEISYPITTDELVSEYGNHAIERTNTDPITIGELFEGMGTERFDSAEEFRQSVLNLMPEDSVGREGYSDRGGSLPEESVDAGDEDEDVSM